MLRVVYFIPVWEGEYTQTLARYWVCLIITTALMRTPAWYLRDPALSSPPSCDSFQPPLSFYCPLSWFSIWSWDQAHHMVLPILLYPAWEGPMKQRMWPNHSNDVHDQAGELEYRTAVVVANLPSQSIHPWLSRWPGARDYHKKAIFPPPLPFYPICVCFAKSRKVTFIHDAELNSANPLFSTNKDYLME